MRRQDFAYSLPNELIARFPTAERSASRLLVLGEAGLQDRQMREFPALLVPEDLLVFNDVRVIKARLYGAKPTGGRVEILIERLLDAQEVIAQLGASKTPKPGSRIEHPGRAEYWTVLGRDPGQGGMFHLRLDGGLEVMSLLDAIGELPLPPYFERAPEAGDAERYQTVFADKPGAVAAPTAGLHFDAALLAAIAARGVRSAKLTLYVGAGTFQPVRVEDLREHRMHAERYELSAALVQAIADTRARGGRVVAVGTTVARALESAAAAGGLQAGAAETRLFITPGYPFRVVDALLTNFHLPESTLLMLVSAFAGTEAIRAAYRHAVAARYRFFSYGDAMFIPARAS